MSVPLTRKTAVVYSLTMLATSGLFFNHLLHLRAAYAETVSDTNVCHDPWLNELIPARKQILCRQNVDGFGFEINGFGVQGECNPKLYNNGSWSSKAQLQTYVDNYIINRKPGVCRDSLVTQALTAAYGRVPRGFGESQDCDMYLYGGGSWSSYSDLLNKVNANKTDMAKNNLDHTVNGLVRPSAPSTVIQKYPVSLSAIPSGSVTNIILNAGGNLVGPSGGTIVAQGGGNLVNTNGSNILAQGGGNIIAQGGGNITANSNGTNRYHTLATGSGLPARLYKIGSGYIMIPINR